MGDGGGATMTAADPTTTATRPHLSVTASTLPPLPVPERPPDDPHAPTPQVVLGTLAIPRIKLERGSAGGHHPDRHQPRPGALARQRHAG